MFGGWTNGGDGNIKYAIYKINNNTISQLNSAEMSLGGWRNNSQAIYLTKVVGYRYL